MLGLATVCVLVILAFATEIEIPIKQHLMLALLGSLDRDCERLELHLRFLCDLKRMYILYPIYPEINQNNHNKINDLASLRKPLAEGSDYFT